MGPLIRWASPWLAGGAAVLALGALIATSWLSAQLDREVAAHAATLAALRAANAQTALANAATAESDRLRLAEAVAAREVIVAERERLTAIEAGTARARAADVALRREIRKLTEQNDALADLLSARLPDDFLRVHCDAAADRGAAALGVCADLLPAAAATTESGVRAGRADSGRSD